MPPPPTPPPLCPRPPPHTLPQVMFRCPPRTHDPLHLALRLSLKRIYIRPSGLVGGTLMPLRYVKSDKIGQLLTISGAVIRVAALRPLVHALRLNCPRCKATIRQPLFDGRYEQVSLTPHFPLVSHALSQYLTGCIFSERPISHILTFPTRHTRPFLEITSFVFSILRADPRLPGA